MKTFEPCIVQEGNKMMMYYDHPMLPSSQRIDVTMAFNLGMAVASKDYERIRHSTLKTL